MPDKSVAIIGAGPAGLAALYEFLHTNSNGTSNLTDPSKTYKDGIPLGDAFKRIVVFESKDTAGGNWAPATKDADLPIPPQHLLDKVNDPFTIKPSNVSPEGIEHATLERPIYVENEASTYESKESRGPSSGPLMNDLEWSRTGIFHFLFTNIPTRFTRYSYLPLTHYDSSRRIFPYLTQQELTHRFSDFISENELDKYIRLNSPVEKVEKHGNKWVLTIRQKAEGGNYWYNESFDYVVVANGHSSLPYIPNIPGLADYNANFPGRMIHAKSFRDVEEFRGKDVLVVGGGISAINVLQYVIPVAKSVTDSKRGPHAVYPYINEALKSDPIISKGTIDYIDGESGKFHFTDGSVGVYDKVIFSTGYHYHFPFFPRKDHFQLVNPGNLCRVGGLFLNTFDQHDPTLGAVGITVSQLNFHTIEASAAALAGVWSGAARLPPLEEQQEWERSMVAERGDSAFFHYYNHHNAKHFINAVSPYFARGRYNPLEADGGFVSEVDEGAKKLEELFHGLKDGRIRIKDTNPAYKEREESKEDRDGPCNKDTDTKISVSESSPILV
ncbi:hypothetical protein KGF57_005040 [Candida theae]|uniref:FAD/NAD(P)-binding domain-containing protein n=1 Tax=Candida theae TaxID=1198502 RepID=A0AAD5B9X6_9ASCO|nr:uncharacterized protein KGF57_005040 [Candida theae]KAI5948977.1 hypothetical protein KGF57_005040 [Candida theae]